MAGSTDERRRRRRAWPLLPAPCCPAKSAALAALVGTVETSVVSVARQMVAVAGKVVTTGSGTSGIMAERLAHLLSVCGTPAVYLPSMDALHGGMGAITAIGPRPRHLQDRALQRTDHPGRPPGPRGVHVVAADREPRLAVRHRRHQRGRAAADAGRRRPRRHDRDGQHAGRRRLERRPGRRRRWRCAGTPCATSSTAIPPGASARAASGPATNPRRWCAAHDDCQR